MALLESIAFILYIRFAILLINIPRHDPFSYRLLQSMTMLLMGGVALDTVLWLGGVSDGFRSGLYTLNRFVLAGMAFVVVPRIFRLRKPVISYFITGTLFFVTGCVLALCVNFIPSLFTRQPNHPLTYPVCYMQIGVVFEVLCFTLGLSRLNQQTEAEKQQVQAQLIEQLRENERKQDKRQRIRTPTDGPLPAEYRRDLFLLFKEALHNLIRHSGATEAFIRLSVEAVDSNKTRLIVTVQDNGRGFDPGEVGPGGNGLRSMHQRAVSLGGTLRIETPGEGGTRLIFRGPVEGITFRSPAGVGVVVEIVS